MLNVHCGSSNLAHKYNFHRIFQIWHNYMYTFKRILELNPPCRHENYVSAKYVYPLLK